jgi:ferredoxin
MTFTVRDGKLDVAVVAGPGLDSWPSAGVRALSTLCAEMGLSVGQFGGESLTVRGVLPIPGTGGLVLVEDAQKRVHRIQARAVVRVSPEVQFPDPFPGWRSQCLIPFPTARRLWKEARISWNPMTVILGTGNRALRFGSFLLENGCEEVYCVETHAQWGAKRFAGWEVERRRFEVLGGRLLEATPVSLTRKSALIWEFRLKDSQGTRILDVARVVSVGPFQDFPGVREHPPGSFLFELDQTAAETKADDVEGWVMEQERGKWLGAKIVRALAESVGDRRDELDFIYRRARGRLKRYLRHREEPFLPTYQGKWLSSSDVKTVTEFKGVPKSAHAERPIASMECFEEIPCNLCALACPESAIEIGHIPRTRDAGLIESKCTGCGACVNACPSGATLMIQADPKKSTVEITLAARGSRKWTKGEFLQLLNRKGDSLGSGRLVAVEEAGQEQRLRIEAPAHLAWEARGVRRPRNQEKPDEAYIASEESSKLNSEKVEITLDGERRLVREGIPVSLALFEIGQGRPGDVLLCKDGSCGLCAINVDGTRKRGCQETIHKGMSIKLGNIEPASDSDSFLCPCLRIQVEDLKKKLEQGKLQTAEAAISMAHVGEGRCHGRLCMSAFKRALSEQDLDPAQWVDWRFPWSDWQVKRS